ncbi:hypothetical protein [Janthinobacterium sp. RB2R34]|uniref:hypothetical protein n=1 Tax=Janthinobacterium sp. RB2R34 TaxID=3424193 RepID=UPI003F2726A1
MNSAEAAGRQPAPEQADKLTCIVGKALAKAGAGDSRNRRQSAARQAYAIGGSFFASVSVIKLRELRKVARYRVVKNHFGYV